MTDLAAEPAAPAPSVLAEVVGSVGVLTLNRPRAVNALDDEMILLALGHLQVWADDNRVRAVWIEGAGDKGLCAGGDVRALRTSLLEGDAGAALSFWKHEYALNALIASYPKPFVAWMDGVVMGGGVGVSAHGSHRLVTERTRLAMPETIIGFFPDVGGLHLLAHAPGELGTHVALTGLPVGGDDAVLLGLADVLVPSATRDAVFADLVRAMTEGVDRAWQPPPAADLPGGAADDPPVAALAEQRGWTDECYRGRDAGAILQALAGHPDPAARSTADVLAQRSPHSVAITLEALRRAEGMDVQQVLAQDRALGPVFAGHPDFVEGIRALLVDKDGAPRWADAHVSDIGREQVLAAFG